MLYYQTGSPEFTTCSEFINLHTKSWNLKKSQYHSRESHENCQQLVQHLNFSAIEQKCVPKYFLKAIDCSTYMCLGPN